MKGMKYAVMSAAISLVFYYHNLFFGGGFWGYVAGILYLYTYRESPTLLAIGSIATAILTIMYFDWEFTLKGYLQVGVAWSMTIIGLTAVLTFLSLFRLLLGKGRK